MAHALPINRTSIRSTWRTRLCSHIKHSTLHHFKPTLLPPSTGIDHTTMLGWWKIRYDIPHNGRESVSFMAMNDNITVNCIRFPYFHCFPPSGWITAWMQVFDRHPAFFCFNMGIFWNTNNLVPAKRFNAGDERFSRMNTIRQDNDLNMIRQHVSE